MNDDLRAELAHDRYPRSARYDPRWVLDSFMGPNVLWSTEALTEHLVLEPGTRVLDLACGGAHSSVFLAREFDLKVWAVDFMISPTENWKRVQQAGVGDRVFPLKGNARALPVPEGMFDAVVCIGAYIYFGTDETYLRILTSFLRKGGQIGIVMPGVCREFDRPPSDLAPAWKLSFETLHSPAWWRHHFDRTGRVQVEVADLVPEGGRDWARWLEICMKHGAADRKFFRAEAEMLREDNDQRFGLVRLVARVRSA